MPRLQRIGAYLDTIDGQRQQIEEALRQELSDNQERENHYPQALESTAWDPPGPVRELWQRFTREADQACAGAKADTAALAAHLGPHWLEKLDRLQKLHGRLLKAAIDGHENFRPLSADLCDQHAVETANARHEWAALDIIERDRTEKEAGEARRRQEREQALPLVRVREAIQRLRSYPGPLDYRSETADADWIELLANLYSALEQYGRLNLLDQLPDRGNARLVVGNLLRLIGSDHRQTAVEEIGSIAHLGRLDEAMLTELTQDLPGDLLGLLPGGDPATAVGQQPANSPEPPTVLPTPSLPWPLVGERTDRRRVSGTKPKRSTERGEGRIKLIAALSEHHKYAAGSCLNQEHIGNNELARKAGVSESTASSFFHKAFKGHSKYRALCNDRSLLVAALKLLNDEFSPHLLYGRTPPGEDERPDDE